MKLRTYEQFCDFLMNDIAWRKKELSDLRFLIKSYKNSHTVNSLIRCGVPVLYAHWEGFIKSSATAYLVYIASQRLNYNQLSHTLIAVSLKKKFIIDEKATMQKYGELVEFVLSGLSERCIIPYDTAINTKSNLSSEVLKDLLNTIGLDYSLFRSKEKIIDEKLLKSRNEIAHGQYLLLTFDSYLNLHEEVLSLLETFKTELENAATLKSYLRTP